MGRGLDSFARVKSVYFASCMVVLGVSILDIECRKVFCPRRTEDSIPSAGCTAVENFVTQMAIKMW